MMHPLKLSLSTQIKSKAMKSQEERVEKMNRQAEKVFQQTSSTKVREDVEEFNKRWKITFQKIGKARSDELVY